MHDVIAFLQARIGKQSGVQRWLAVVEMPLRQDPDHVVEVEVSRIGARRRDIVALPSPLPSDDRPRSGTEEILPVHFGKSRLDPRIGDSCRSSDLLRIGAPYQVELLFPIHLRPPAFHKPRTSMRGEGL